MVEVRPTKGQIDNLIGEVKRRVDKGQRVLVTTLTKRMAVVGYLKEMGVRTQYLRSDIETLERVEILPAPGRIRRGGGHQPPAARGP